ncbi:MAG: hypothetical protein EOO34_00235 [Cyanobacteriota bacterium]|nr:MAG: hypothetical protein EOO34_00235 [Cyanobacteriota bacterium]
MLILAKYFILCNKFLLKNFQSIVKTQKKVFDIPSCYKVPKAETNLWLPLWFALWFTLYF